MKINSFKLLLMIGASALLSSTRLVFAAEGTPPSAATPTPFVEKLNYSSPIIGTSAPDFALPDMAHKPWNLSEHTGQHSILLLIVSGQPRPADESDTGELILAVLKKQALRLQSQNVDVVLATQGITPHQSPKANTTADASSAKPAQASSSGSHLISPQDRELLHILRDDGSLAKMYGVMPQRVVGVLIDRYGILREVNYWPFGSKALDAALQNVDVSTSAVEVGKPAPDFALPDSSGQMRRLSDLRGKHNVLLTFFPEGSTCGCGSQLPSVDNDLPMFYANNTEVWLLSSDGAQEQNELIETLHSSMPFIPDVDKKVAQLYQATTNPTEETEGMSVLIDKNGIVRYIDKVPGRLYSEATTKKMSELNATSNLPMP